MIPFLKMHGLGNDFVVFDARNKALSLSPGTARAIADRHRGVGCDQLIVIERGGNGFDARMRSLNADGGEVESCGNASRCVARLLMEELHRPRVKIETLGGPLACADAGSGNIRVDMGRPSFAWKQIPLAYDVDATRFTLNVADKTYTVSAVSVGNPHCVFLVEDAEGAPVESLGPLVEIHPMFPNRTNVEFMHLCDRTHLRLRVWERGAGVTKACGTGACAAAAVAHRLGYAERKVEVMLDGGPLGIELREGDEHILMTGPATLSFRGELDLKAFA